MIQRGKAEYLGGTKFKFICKNGHTSQRDFSKGPAHQRIGVAGCQILWRGWKDSGCSWDCKLCK
jgi:hypothetical protein